MSSLFDYERYMDILKRDPKAAQKYKDSCKKGESFDEDFKGNGNGDCKKKLEAKDKIIDELKAELKDTQDGYETQIEDLKLDYEKQLEEMREEYEELLKKKDEEEKEVLKEVEEQLEEVKEEIEKKK